VESLKRSYLGADVKPTVVTVINPDILGGYQAQVGEFAIDKSLKSNWITGTRK
jgi:F0F1-type ATP synthase delta subunit